MHSKEEDQALDALPLISDKLEFKPLLSITDAMCQYVHHLARVYMLWLDNLY